jgi:hypothetical protein
MIYCFLLIQEHTGPVKNAFSAVDRYEVKKTNVVKLKAKPSTVVKSSEESHQSHHQVIFIKSKLCVHFPIILLHSVDGSICVEERQPIE